MRLRTLYSKITSNHYKNRPEFGKLKAPYTLTKSVYLLSTSLRPGGQVKLLLVGQVIGGWFIVQQQGLAKIPRRLIIGGYSSKSLVLKAIS